MDLEPCPFCGSTDNEDSPWPRNRERTEWVCCCGNPTCAVRVYGPSPDEAARRWNRRATVQPDAASTNSPEVSGGLVVPFYYRLQDKRDPYRHMNFDPSAWNFILVPAVPGEGVVGYSAADNSPASQEGDDQ